MVSRSTAAPPVRLLAAAGAGLFGQLTPRAATKNIPLTGKRKEKDHWRRKDGKRGRRAGRPTRRRRTRRRRRRRRRRRIGFTGVAVAAFAT